ncbi:hypothetical protein BC332_03129 [Capsicum chinense]|nr:hypothetical protein BC332_03129 [Capsicum chinense]
MYEEKPMALADRQDQMDDSMKQLQEKLIEVEIEGENLLLARQKLVENDRVRNGNREALTALRRRAKTTKTSIPTPFASIMKDVESRPLVKEICPTCGNHDSKEKTWVMFPGTDIFANIPFHAAHTILEKDQTLLDYEAKKLQSFVKEKSLWISDQGVLADRISPGVLRSMVTLTDKPNWLLGADQTLLDYEAKKLQSFVKEKSLWISDQGVLADRISPGVLRSMVTLTDKPKTEQNE